VATRNPFELAEEIVVETLTRPLGVDLAMTHDRWAAGRGGKFLRWIQGGRIEP
jgi:hypothetical protein